MEFVKFQKHEFQKVKLGLLHPIASFSFQNQTTVVVTRPIRAVTGNSENGPAGAHGGGAAAHAAALGGPRGLT
jgi:hypothetical protein